MTEWDMVLDCKSMFEQSGHYSKIQCEVPFLSRCIDMVLLDKKNRVITIEFKLKDWRHAIEQAYDHMRGADYAYICIPMTHPSKLLISELNKYGIGLLLYHSSCTGEEKVTVYRKADKSSRKVPVLQTDIIRNVHLCK